MKNFKIYISVLSLLGSSILLNGQQQNRFWYFGNNIGIDFGPGLDNPQPIIGIGNNTLEGSGVVSDTDGNFLFYTDGSSAINNLNNTFGTDLGGSEFSTQSSIAVPDPSSCDDYYIFSVGAYEVPDTWGLFYAKISSTTWTVLETGVMDCPNCVEKITAIPHSNGMDYWIVSVQPNSKTIPVYLLNSNGFIRTTDSQDDLSFMNGNFSLTYGAIKGSHDGTKIGIASGINQGDSNSNRVDLLSFNNTTGEVTGLLNSFDFPTAYGIEFSPSNEYLFVSSLGGGINTGEVRQYLSSPPYTLTNSQTLPSNESWDAGGIQLGPDGNIYLARYNSNRLGAITNPNSINWGYVENAVTFPNCTQCVQLSLPNLVGSPNECDPCDISNSLIPNPDFENLVDPNDLPDALAQLDKLENWVQASEGTSDFLNFISMESPNDFLHVGDVSNRPPNATDNFVGLHWNFPNTHGQIGEYVEYVGSCTNGTLNANTDYTIEFYIGTTDGADSRYSTLGFQGDIIFLGIPDCNMLPLDGHDCKEDDFDVLGRVSLNVPPDNWLPNKVNVILNGPNNYEAIMFGPSCNPYPDGGDGLRSYFLIDEILVVQGDIDCGNTCHSINAEAPLCNEDNASYTYDFTLVNNMTDNSFDKLLILDQDEGFSLDLGGNTLVQLDNTVGPGQSIDLSWTIEGTSTEEATFCFDIIPYNPQGEMCCKEEHCVTLESCCSGPPSASVTINEEEMSEEMCCYSLDYENVCLPDYYTRLQVEMLTPGLGVQAMGGNNADFSVTPINASLVELTFDSGTFPEGVYDDVMSFCVTGVSHTSPDVQELRYRWYASVDGGPESIVEINTFEAMCIKPTPPDTCTVITNDNLYCDDNGVYHYSFQVSNFSQGEYNASILVIGPVGDTEPSDFSQQTFPEFPDNTPGAPTFLEYGETSGVLDVTLPNAQLGDSYQFFLSLHDYRMPLANGDYWCCFDTLDVITLDIDFSCGIGGLVEDPLSHEIYPNPVEDNFTILFEQRIPADSDIIIKDIRGNLMDIHDIKSETHYHTINTSEYLTGLYFVIVRDALGNMTHSKFVRN